MSSITRLYAGCLPTVQVVGSSLLVLILPLLTLEIAAQTAPQERSKPEEAAEQALVDLWSQADGLMKQGKFAEAVEPAQKAVELAAKASGPNDWRTFDADQRKKLAETGRDLPEGKRERLAKALQAEAEAQELQDTKPTEAEKLALEAAEGYAAVLGEETLEFAWAWHLTGRIRIGRNDFEGAKEAIQKSLAIRRKALPADHPAIAANLSNLGIVQHELGDSAKAKASYEEALGIFRKVLPEDDPGIVACLSNLGTVQCELGDFPAAKASREKVLLILRRTLPARHPDIATSLNNLGAMQVGLGDYAAAKASFEEALAIYRMALPEGHANIATTLNNLGGAQYVLRNYADAKANYEEALVIYRKSLPEGHPDIAKALINLGLVQLDLGDYGAAKANCETALNILRKALSEGHPDIADGLNSLGLVQYELGDYAAAKASCEEALSIRREALPATHPAIAKSLNNLGRVKRKLRDFTGAIASHEEALEICRKTLPENQPDVALNWDNLASVYYELGDYDTARKNYEKVLGIYREALHDDDPKIADTLNNLGLAQGRLRDLEGARASYEEALRIYHKFFPDGHSCIAMSLNNLGSIQFELGDSASALKNYEEALSTYRKTLPENHPFIAMSLNNLGAIGVASGAPTAEAVDNLEEALAIHRSHLLGLAGSQAEAEQLQAVNDARSTLSVYLSATLRPGAEVSAITLYDQAAGLKGLVTARQRWARELRDSADPKTRTLLDELQTVNARLFHIAVGPDQAASVGLEASTGSVVELIDLDAKRKELERQLAARSAAFRRYQEKADLGGNAIQAALPAGVCLLDFLEYVQVGPSPAGKTEPTYERRLLAFVVRPGKEPVQIVDLGVAERIDELVRRWREQSVNRTPFQGAETDPAVELREQVWLKLEPYLGQPEVVLVSPDGPLNFLPLAALPGKEADTYLIQEYAFAVAPAPILLPELLATQPSRPKSPSLLLVGGVDFGESNNNPPPSSNLPAISQNWSPLKGTLAETEGLKRQFSAAFQNAKIPKELMKVEAIKETFVATAPNYSYLHLATHGFFADEAETSVLDVRSAPNPIRLDRAVAGRNPGVLSGIIFAGINRPPGGAIEDCLLTALEAAELDLRRAELVTLSACNTGQGQTAGGEGVVGLQRAFLVAGARSVVASQWKIPDAPTQALMQEFYKRVWDQKHFVSQAEALRQAQRMMIDKWDVEVGAFRGSTEAKDEGGSLAPIFWAAFTLSGDWR